MFIFPNEMVMKAFYMARDAHSKQTRKFTGEPYIVHPINVARMVYSVEYEPVIVAAALLHDVIEDTDTSFGDLVAEFGTPVASTVQQLSNLPAPELSRRERAELNITRLGAATARAQTIKVADILDNLTSMAKYDPVFTRKVYLPEKILTLSVLTKANKYLLAQARSLTASLSQVK